MSRVYLNSAAYLTKITSIRLTPENRLFIERYAKQMNMSINGLINKLIENSADFNDFVPTEESEEGKDVKEVKRIIPKAEKVKEKVKGELRIIGIGHWRPIYCKELDVEFASKRHCARFFHMGRQTLDKAIEKGHYYSPKLGKIVTFEYVTHY